MIPKAPLLGVVAFDLSVLLSLEIAFETTRAGDLGGRGGEMRVEGGLLLVEAVCCCGIAGRAFSSVGSSKHGKEDSSVRITNREKR